MFALLCLFSFFVLSQEIGSKECLGYDLFCAGWDVKPKLHQSISCLFVRLLVCSSCQILLPRYLMNGMNNFDKTDGEYSLAPIDEWTGFQKWRVKELVTVE